MGAISCSRCTENYYLQNTHHLARTIHVHAGADHVQPAHGPLRTGRDYLEHLQRLSAAALVSFVPAQALVKQFVDTFKEFPPRQKPSSFSVDQIMEQLEKPSGG